MKITKSKRFLAMLLSVLMVLTSLPIAAFTAFAAAAAAEDPAVTEVKTAMQKYEQKLDNGTVYTNMSAAYQAYVDCQKALDAYQYGTTKNDDGSYQNDFTGALSGKADALNNAINNMSEFVPYTGTAHGTFPSDKDYVSDDNYKENYKNILYSAPVTTTPVYYAENQPVTDPWRGWLFDDLYASTADTSIFMSTDTVMLYDGVTNPQTGVMMGTWGRKTHGNFNNLAWYYCFIGTGQGLSMVNDNWSGTDGAGSGGWNLNYQWTIRQISSSKTGACAGSKVVTQYENGVSGKVTANAIQFNRDFSTLFYTINNPSFEYRIGLSDDRKDQKEYTAQASDTVIRVLNYKMIKEAIDAQKGYLPNVENYKQGGLATVMQGFDQATTDPNSFFTTSNDWQGAQNHYQTAINNLKAAATADNSQYDILRNGLKENVQYANTYNKGTNGWTAESWANYTAVYEKTVAVLSAPYTTGTYAPLENGQALLDDLKAAFDALKSNIAFADTTDLVNSIQTFRSWENIFTEDSYQFTSKYVDEAVIAVWGEEENLGIKTFGPEDTDEGRKLVSDQLTMVNDAINLLRISPDAKISTSHGKYSLNQALAIVVDNPSQYFNYSEFTTAVENGNVYKATLPVTEFTDYTTLYNKYIEEVTKIVDAYYNLAYAFTDIPDGTVVQNSGFTKTQPMIASDQGRQSIAFGYTNSAVLIRTTHEAKSMPYGKFSITFGTNISASSNNDKNNNKNTNNGLDSITLNATQAPISDNFLQRGKAGNTALSDRKVPEEMSVEDREVNYAGLLEYNGFSVSNLRYTGKSSNCDPLYYITDNDGVKVATTDEQARTIDLDPILGKTDGTNNGNVVKGSVYAYSSNSGFAYTYIDGDLNVNVEPSPAVELTRSTQPSSKNYRLTDNYIGAVTSYTCRNTVYCAGRCWFTTQTAGDAMDTSVAVVDLSYLIDLVKICDQIAPLKSKYTADSFAKFEQALYDAKSPYDYSKQSAGNIASEGSSRYTKLWSAYQNLVERPQVLTFNYMDENGQPTSSTVEIAYNANIATVRSEIDAIVVPNYSLNGTSYTFKGWDPAVNNATVVTSDAVYTATYDSFATAYWGNYNASKDTLLNTLANGKFSAEGLNEVKAQVEELQYFLYTDNQKLMVSASNQGSIDAEKAAMDAINAKLAEIALDSSTYDAIVKTIDTLNADAYDVATVASIVESTPAGTPVTIAGVEYTGWDFDNFVKAVIEAMNSNAYEYTVTVMDVDENEYFLMADGSYTDDPELAAKFHYGDVVNAVNPIDSTQECSWTVSIVAQLTSTETTEKYVATASNYQFNVRGATTLKTSANEDSDSYHTISFIDSRTNTLISSMTVAHNGTARMRNALLPTIPFYEVKNFTNRATGATVTKTGSITKVTTDINLTVNYTPVEEVTGYNIILLDVNGTEIHNAQYNWNQKVNLSATGAAGMIDTATGKLVAYGSDYSFYACQSITLQAVSSTDGKAAVSVVDPVISNSKMYLTGSFALPENVTVKGYGIVMDTYGNHPDLTLKDVDMNNFVFNMASSKLTCGNQFTVYTGSDSAIGRHITYRAYVIYEMNGTELIEYSNVKDLTVE